MSSACICVRMMGRAPGMRGASSTPGEGGSWRLSTCLSRLCIPKGSLGPPLWIPSNLHQVLTR